MREKTALNNEGWGTELFAEHAGKQLKHLGKLLIRDDLPTQKELAELLTTGFSCTPLRPAEGGEVVGGSFHGHVRAYSELSGPQRNALKNAGYQLKSGRIVRTGG